VTTVCGHSFCEECLRKWLELARPPTCPIDRKIIPRECPAINIALRDTLAARAAPASVIRIQQIPLSDLEVDGGRPLGSGSFGSVRSAKWCGAPVALKVIDGDPDSVDQATLSSFQKEITVLSHLHHPNIVQLFGVYTDPSTGTTSLVLELADCDLDKHRSKRGALRPLPVEECVSVGLDIVRGLYFAHKRGITHNDLKPGNILMKGQIAKLCDFGLAKVLRATILSSRKSGIIGTLIYCAPENFDGKNAGYGKSPGDIYVRSLTSKFCANSLAVPPLSLSPLPPKCHNESLRALLAFCMSAQQE